MLLNVPYKSIGTIEDTVYNDPDISSYDGHLSMLTTSSYPGGPFSSWLPKNKHNMVLK